MISTSHISPEQEYQEEIFSFLRHRLKKYVDTGKVPSLKILIEDLLSYIGLESLSQKASTQIENWFRDITQQRFLRDIIHTYKDKLCELIIHSPSYVKIITQSEESTTTINISSDDLQASLEILALNAQSSWNYVQPVSSFYAAIESKKTRVTLVHHSILNHQLTACIRFHSLQIFELNQYYPEYMQQNDSEGHRHIKEMVAQKKNILISGATKSGKTSFLNTLLSFIPECDHLISIEDTPELQIQREHFTSLINNDEHRQSELKELCRHALRLSPDRIVLGEMRGPEALSFILAMNTGHRGLMSTLHANNAQDALERVALLFHFYGEQNVLGHHYLMDMICRNIDIVIHMENKKITSIIEVRGCENGRPIYCEIYSEDSLPK